jgi:endogenous inhibitor of DNA gyrase (YacG/DUF329 family)
MASGGGSDNGHAGNGKHKLPARAKVVAEPQADPAAAGAPSPAPDRPQSTPPVRQVPCPQCGKPAAWVGNPSRPFCSERCRLIDLGQWADGSYAVAGEPVREPSEDDEP